MPRLPLSAARSALDASGRFTVRGIAGVLDCDGATNQIVAPDHADLQPGAGDFTLCGWVMPRTTTSGARVWDKRSGTGFMLYQYFSGTSPQWNAYILDGAAHSATLGFRQEICGAWSFLAMERDGNNLRLFLFGPCGIQAGAVDCSTVGSLDVAVGLGFGSTSVPASRSNLLLSDVGWWKGTVLSQAQLLDVARRNEWASGLTSRWRCNAIVGGKILDDVSGHDAVVTAGTINMATVRERLRTTTPSTVRVVVSP